MSITELLSEFMPLFCVPLCIAIFRALIRIVKDIAQRNLKIGERENERKEKINELKRINIDEDLQKYFNYKE